MRREVTQISSAGGQALALLLSPEGTFVRDILMDELAKGLDAAWRIAADQSGGSARRALSSILRVCTPSPSLLPAILPSVRLCCTPAALRELSLSADASDS